jgi:hypothetical protein
MWCIGDLLAPFVGKRRYPREEGMEVSIWIKTWRKERKKRKEELIILIESGQCDLLTDL